MGHLGLSLRGLSVLWTKGPWSIGGGLGWTQSLAMITRDLGGVQPPSTSQYMFRAAERFRRPKGKTERRGSEQKHFVFICFY